MAKVVNSKGKKNDMSFTVELNGNAAHGVREFIQEKLSQEKPSDEDEGFSAVWMGSLARMNGPRLYLWTFGIKSYYDAKGKHGVVEAIQLMSPASHDDRLKPKDHILEVNSTPASAFFGDERKRSFPSAADDLLLKLKVVRPTEIEGDSKAQKKSTGTGNKDDEIIFNVRGKEILSLRSLVSAHSPVLEAMFRHDTLENQTKRIKVDFDPKTFDCIIHFFETGHLKPMGNGYPHLFEVAKAADYYQIKGIKELKTQLDQHLQLCKSKETAVPMVTMAYELGLEQEPFMKSIMMFIAMWLAEIDLNTLPSDLGERIRQDLENYIRQEKMDSTAFITRLKLQLKENLSGDELAYFLTKDQLEDDATGEEDDEPWVLEEWEIQNLDIDTYRQCIEERRREIVLKERDDDYEDNSSEGSDSSDEDEENEKDLKAELEALVLEKDADLGGYCGGRGNGGQE